MTTETVIADLSVRSPVRVLAESLRAKLGSSPADLGDAPAGRLEVERAYLPVYALEDSTKTVVCVTPGDQAGTVATRSGAYRTQRTVQVEVSVQQLLACDPQSLEGLQKLDDLMDYSERVLRACLTKIQGSNGMVFAASDISSTSHDQEALREWNQFAVVHTVAYEVIA